MSENYEIEKEYKLLINSAQMEAYNKVKELLKCSEELVEKLEQEREYQEENNLRENDENINKETGKEIKLENLLDETDILYSDDEKIKIGLEVLADFKKIYQLNFEEKKKISDKEKIVVSDGIQKENQKKEENIKSIKEEQKRLVNLKPWIKMKRRKKLSNIEEMGIWFEKGNVEEKKKKRNIIYLGKEMTRKETYESYWRQIFDIFKSEITTTNMKNIQGNDGKVNCNNFMGGNDFYMDLIYNEKENNLDML